MKDKVREELERIKKVIHETIEDNPQLEGLLQPLTVEQWHQKYKDRLIKLGFGPTSAEKTLQAGIGNFDYADDPEDAVDEELSYWSHSSSK